MKLTVRIIDDEGDDVVTPFTIELDIKTDAIFDLQRIVKANANACICNSIYHAVSLSDLYVFSSVSEALRDNRSRGLPQDAFVEDVLCGRVDERTPTYLDYRDRDCVLKIKQTTSADHDEYDEVDDAEDVEEDESVTDTESDTMGEGGEYEMEEGIEKDDEERCDEIDCDEADDEVSTGTERHFGESQLTELVILPEGKRCSMRRSSWSETLLPPWNSVNDDESNVWRLPSMLLIRDPTPPPDLRPESFFFQRDVFKRLMRELLQERVVDNGDIGWLRGPHGYGATWLALVFAFVHLRHDWTITLIGEGSLAVARYDQGGTRCLKKKLRTRAMMRVDVKELLDEVPASTKHFVICSRLMEHNHKGRMLDVIADWYKADTATKRLVFVETGAPTAEHKQRLAFCDDSVRGTMSEAIVPAWTVDEYLEAAQHDGFYACIKDRLIDREESPRLELSREARVRGKYFFSGGNVAVFRSGWGSLQTLSKQHAVSTYDAGGSKPAYVVTPYMTAWTAIARGVSGIRDVHTSGDAVSTRFVDAITARDGSLLETQFLATLDAGSLTLYELASGGSQQVEVTWTGRIDWLKIDQDFRGMALKPVLAEEDGPQWWKRPRYNYGGFDAVFVDCKAGLVRFVQLVKPFTAHGVVHWVYMASFLKELMACASRSDSQATSEEESSTSTKRKKLESSLMIRRVEMAIVMAEEALAGFQISEMRDTQQMVETARHHSQDTRWAAHQDDVTSLVRLLGMRDVWTSWRDCQEAS